MSRRMWLVGCCLALVVITLHSQTKVSPAPPTSVPFRTGWAIRIFKACGTMPRERRLNGPLNSRGRPC